MTVYARSDVMSVSVPASSGGCNRTHTRPVDQGAPVRIWELNCPQCEGYLRGTGKPQVIKATHFNPTTGEPGQVQHVADADPLWGSNPDTTPSTPDEKRTRSYTRELNEKRMHALEIATSFKNAGIDVTKDPEIMDFLRQNGVGDRFLEQLAIPKDEKKEQPVPDEDEPEITEIPLVKIHISSLRKMCREEGIPDKGNKEQLVQRLENARKRVSI